MHQSSATKCDTTNHPQATDEALLAKYSNAFRQQSQVSQAAAVLTTTLNTTVDLDFIHTLIDLATFWCLGKGVFWERDEAYHFFDGDIDLNMRPEGPVLYYFNNIIEDVE